MDIEKILTEGIIFKGSKSPSVKKEEKVKTKAKKKTYITGLHAPYPLHTERASVGHPSDARVRP